MKRLLLKKLFLTAIVLMCFATGQAQVTSTSSNTRVVSDSTKKTNDLPVEKNNSIEKKNYQPKTPRSLNFADYPKIVDTGDPVKDKLSFETKKKEWEKSMGITSIRIFSQEELDLNNEYAMADNAKIQEFMRSVLNRDLPTGYNTPMYISKSGDAYSANEMISLNYPEFSGKQYLDLISAVRENPALYVRLIMEYRAVRLIHQSN
jgi:hypothetical protein